MIQAKKVSCLVELEGHSVEFSSISISESRGSYPVAQISFPATISIISLLPKTVANVFYDIDGKYYLIFQGEYSGYSISKLHDRQEVALVFEGITANWYHNPILSVDKTIGNMMADATMVMDYADASGMIGGRKSFTIANTIFSPLQHFQAAMKVLSEQIPTPLVQSTTTEQVVNVTIPKETTTSNEPNVEAILAALRGKESGGNYKIGQTRVKALNVGLKNTASGGYQITNPTWREKWNPHYPQYSTANDAPAEIQDDYMRIKITRFFHKNPNFRSAYWYFAAHYYGEGIVYHPDRLTQIPSPESGNTETVDEYLRKVMRKYLKITNGGEYTDTYTLPLIKNQITMGKALKDTINYMFTSFGYQGRYYRNIAKFLGLTSDYVNIVQSDVIESIISDISVMQMITGNFQRIAEGSPCLK